MAASDLDKDPGTQHVDVRFYFPAETDRETFLYRIGMAVQDSPEMAELTAAYEMRAGEAPLA